MTQAEFIEIIKEMGITNYSVEPFCKVRIMKKGSYYRVSNFEDDPDFNGHDGLYVRENGLCDYKPESIVFEDLLDYVDG